jgi:hypothetical protein
MFYQYGLFKPLVVKKLKKPTSLRQLIPPFFLIGLILGFILSAFSKIFLYLYLLSISCYIALNILITTNAIIKERKNLTLLPLIFPCIHISYGYGYIVGLIRSIFRKKLKIKNNR